MDRKWRYTGPESPDKHLWRTMKLEWAHLKAHSNESESQAGPQLYFHGYDIRHLIRLGTSDQRQWSHVE